MKNIYLIQIGFSFDKSLVYLPYGAGCLAAAAMADEEIAANYNKPVILFERDTIENTFAKIKDPFIVSFSTYFWNEKYNQILAKKVKEKYPDCIIAFGGHNIPPNSDRLKDEQYIDVLMHGEGEVSYPLFLKAALKGMDFSSVPGADFRKNGEIISIPQQFTEDISSFPSPYLTGIFDDILEEYPDIDFHATIETNRGCPYTCAYCNWSTDKKLRLFPMEKVKAEIEWVSDHKIAYCYCADGNFGLFERDIEIAKWIVNVRKRNGYPNIFKPCYAKNSDDIVFEAGRILNEEGADKGVTISYQTLSQDALDNINRENLDVNVFRELSKRYNEIGIPTYSDLIIGLPGETFESFSKSLADLMEIGQHNSVTFHHCQVYPNAPMGKKDYQEKYKIELSHVPIDEAHYTTNKSGVAEYFDIVTGTYSMTRSDWEKTNVYGVCIEAFHYIGLTRCFALYLRNEKNVPYLEFYNALFDYLNSHPETQPGKYFAMVYDTVRHPERPWAYQKDIFSSTNWYLEEGWFLESAYNDEEFWEDMLPFLNTFFGDDEIFPQLLMYQKEIIRKPNKNEMHLEIEYDFYNYFRRIYEGRYAPIEKRKNILHIFMEKNITQWDEYAREIIWYGKRRSATLATNDRESITVEYL